MKTLVSIVLVLVGIVPSLAADQARHEVDNLSQEEIALVSAFRRDPAPFRRVLLGLGTPGDEWHSSLPLVGVNDVIDVMVDRGEVQFHGARRPFEPVSFRIVRGQEKVITFCRLGLAFEQTAVRVAYRVDGLHFDVPAPGDARDGSRLGGIVMAEDPRWEEARPIELQVELPRQLSRTSEIRNPRFRIRYVKLEQAGVRTRIP